MRLLPSRPKWLLPLLLILTLLYALGCHYPNGVGY